MVVDTAVVSADVLHELTHLVALSPPRLVDINAAVREVCASTLGLPPLPAETGGGAVDPMVTEFAEQFSTDVTEINAAARAAFSDLLGPDVFTVSTLIYVADFVPRMRAGLSALGVDWPAEPVAWDHDSNPADYVLDVFLPAVGRMRALDPVTSEMVRLRGARQHNCRLCKSLREAAALEAGATEADYDDIDHFENSNLSDRHKAALRYVDAVIWTPARVSGDELRQHFSQDEAVELTLDIMRNACNKVAVALGVDEARVDEGTEQYRLGADGQPIYS
ncbi:alkylhydroperoxidase family enzyme [Mycobacterium frederiksbergense]|uniref:Alkylhydroperoxidase family enzyme n=1 Tax=Mycolicibacterium frederiksbergense TaxID=117567 RepID=A0ABT6KW22_9MYCO|nr:carboxymuconolactone decarboxylase family protein [Mycolicibacterium frederiksbergense]MDH6194886.1 alkylhydroperoxidase family enzyme [Mycolicibacterium frederiksbergense]